MTLRHPLALLLAACTGAAALAQEGRPVAFTNARILTISGKPIERGTLVMKNGKIDGLGADLPVPAGARVIDASGKTLMPGLVSAWSRAGMQAPAPRFEDFGGGRRRGMPMGNFDMGGGQPAANKAATKVVDALHPKQQVFGELLRLGITTLSLNPSGPAFPGLGAVLRPDGKTLQQLTVDDDAFVQIGMARTGETKKLLKETLAKAQKLVAERKQPPAPAPAAAAPGGDGKPNEKPNDGKEPPKGETPPKPEPPKPEPKPEPPKPEPPKPEPPKGDGKEPPKPPSGDPQAQKKPEAPKDPNLEVLADLLEGKRRALVQMDAAADLLHWQQAIAADVTFPLALVVPRHDPLAGTIDVVLEKIVALKCPVLLPPELSTMPRTRHLTHPAKALHDAGVEIGFAVGDNGPAVRSLFFRLMEVVRAGLPADVALRAVTLTPAKMLGVDKKKGSLELGKDADLLVFTGDPLSPSGQLSAVWLGGVEVPPQP